MGNELLVMHDDRDGVVKKYLVKYKMLEVNGQKGIGMIWLTAKEIIVYRVHSGEYIRCGDATVEVDGHIMEVKRVDSDMHSEVLFKI